MGVVAGSSKSAAIVMKQSLIFMHIFFCGVLSFGIYGMFRYYQALMDSESDLAVHWANTSPKFLTFMKYFIPLMILGMTFSVLVSAIELIFISLMAD